MAGTTVGITTAGITVGKAHPVNINDPIKFIQSSVIIPNDNAQSQNE